MKLLKIILLDNFRTFRLKLQLSLQYIPLKIAMAALAENLKLVWQGLGNVCYQGII
jgi:hypothetical protein